MSDLLDYSANELSSLYQAQKLSPVEVLETVLIEAASSQTAINAFCHFGADSALAQARESAARWQAGRPLGALDGVPVSIKDNVATQDMPTRFGSQAVSAEAAMQADSPCVARLREAGAVLFGKTTLPDFAHKILTDSPVSGITRNPWNRAHTPGGSSGGASAAVASGLGPLAIGTDGGGSIRVPAAFTGIFGFKPSFGRVPHYPRGAFALLSHVGPMTRTVADAALVMNVITKPDARDWYSLPYDGVDYLAHLRRRPAKLRVACSTSLGLDVPVEQELLQVLLRSAQYLEETGADVDGDDPPAIQMCNEIHRTLWTSFSARLVEQLGAAASQLDPSLLALAHAGEKVSRDGLLQALMQRGEAGKQVGEFFTRHDLLLCPVYPTLAPNLAECDAVEPPVPIFTPWCNQLGLPAASVFCGFGASGLPLAVQIVGPRFADLAVLQAAQILEAAWGVPPRAKVVPK